MCLLLSHIVTRGCVVQGKGWWAESEVVVICHLYCLEISLSCVKLRMPTLDYITIEGTHT